MTALPLTQQSVELKISQISKSPEDIRIERRNSFLSSVLSDPAGIDTKSKSYLTVEELRKMVPGHKASEMAEYYFACEQEEGINAFVALSISAHESGYADYIPAQKQQDYFGLNTHGKMAGFDCFKIFCNTLNNMHKKGKTTVAAIAADYSEDPNWREGITDMMYTLVTKENQYAELER